MRVFDWFLQRLNGVPNCDGYGSQTLTLIGGQASATQTVNLGRNSMYMVINDGYSTHAETVFFKVLSAWNTFPEDGTPDNAHNLSEAVATDVTGVTLLSGAKTFITTNTYRHVFSVCLPTGSSKVAVVKLIKMEPGKVRDEKDESQNG